MKNLLFIAIAIFGFSAVSFGQQSTATISTTTATANIIAPITIGMVNNMNFGTIAKSALLGTVELSAAGGRSASGGATLGVATGVQAARFHVTGDETALYSITLPGNTDVTLTSATPGINTMTVTNFTNAVVGLGTLGTLSGGVQDFTVGAILTVKANQVAASDYTGTFAVTVTYN